MKKFLIGPITYTELISKKYDKHIILLGDEHSVDVFCPANSGAKLIPVEHWIYKQIKKVSRTKIVDIFLECGYKNKHYDCIEQGNCFLKNVYNHFESSLDIDKSKSINKNIRAHYTDIRLFKHPVMYNLYYIESLINIIDYRPYVFVEWMKFIDRDKIKHLQLPSFLEIIDSAKIKRQIDNIKDKELSQRIYDYYKNIYETSMIYKRFDDIRNIMLKVSDNVINNIKNISQSSEGKNITNADIDPYMFINELTKKDICLISRASKSILKTTSHLMDAYLLGRVFRSYKECDSLDSKYIIIYTGNFHTDQYLKFLVKNDFSLITRKTSTIEEYDFQCIDITDIEYVFN